MKSNAIMLANTGQNIIERTALKELQQGQIPPVGAHYLYDGSRILQAQSWEERGSIEGTIRLLWGGNSNCGGT
jgi:hypothetical protein